MAPPSTTDRRPDRERLLSDLLGIKYKYARYSSQETRIFRRAWRYALAAAKLNPSVRSNQMLQQPKG